MGETREEIDMSAIKLKGVFYSEASGAFETLSTSSMASMVEEPNLKGTGGVAYRVDWGGCKMGYLPEVQTLRDEYRKARSYGGQMEQEALIEQGVAVKDCRYDLRNDPMNLARVWMCKVCKVVKKGNEIDEIWIEWGV